MKKLTGAMGLALALCVTVTAFGAETVIGSPDASVVDGILRVRTGDSSAVFKVQNNGMQFLRTGTIFFDNITAGGRYQFRTSTTANARDVVNITLQNNGDIDIPTSGAQLTLSNINTKLGIGTGAPTAALDVRGTASVQVLEITGGADLAESFNIAVEDHAQVVPGMVVAIDPARPGQLRVSDKAYDKTVAGVISGANDLNTALMMGQKGSAADGAHPVALTGRVYCYVDASYGAVQPGDMLTTSATPGHAMKVTDHAQAVGAILGKAMTPLAEGKGLVLVLVSLQ